MMGRSDGGEGAAAQSVPWWARAWLIVATSIGSNRIGDGTAFATRARAVVSNIYNRYDTIVKD